MSRCENVNDDPAGKGGGMKMPRGDHDSLELAPQDGPRA